MRSICGERHRGALREASLGVLTESTLGYWLTGEALDVPRTLGLLLPRHTTDQRAFVASADAPHGRGDLIFTWTERHGACHVGVVTEYGTASRGDFSEARVIHASRSRRRVVEEPLLAFTLGATRVEYARYSDLILRHAEHVGAAQIRLRG